MRKQALKIRNLFFLFFCIAAGSCNMAQNQNMQHSRSEQETSPDSVANTDTTQTKPATAQSVTVPEPPQQRDPRPAAKVHTASSDQKSDAQARLLRMFETVYKGAPVAQDSLLRNAYWAPAYTRINDFIKNNLKTEINNWQGVVMAITELEHAAIEVEVIVPIAGDIRPRYLVFSSIIPTSDIDIVTSLSYLSKGDTVIFSGNVETYGGTSEPIRAYGITKEEALRYPFMVFLLKKIEEQ